MSKNQPRGHNRGGGSGRMSVQNRVARPVAVLLACAAVYAAAIVGPASAAPSPSASTLPADHPDGAVLSKYCFACHNEQRPCGGLVLRQGLRQCRRGRRDVGKGVRKLRRGHAAARTVAADLQTTDAFVQSPGGPTRSGGRAAPNPGRTQPCTGSTGRIQQRRPRPAGALTSTPRHCCPPTMRTPRGWTIMPSLLTVSPARLDRYLIVARKVSRLALACRQPGRSSRH